MCHYCDDNSMFGVGISKKQARRAKLLYGVCYKHVELAINELSSSYLPSDYYPVVSNLNHRKIYYSYFDAFKKKLSFIEGWNTYFEVRKVHFLCIRYFIYELKIDKNILYPFLNNFGIDTVLINRHDVLNFDKTLLTIDQFQLCLNNFGKEYIPYDFETWYESHANIIKKETPIDPEESFYRALKSDNLESWGY